MQLGRGLKQTHTHLTFNGSVTIGNRIVNQKINRGNKSCFCAFRKFAVFSGMPLCRSVGWRNRKIALHSDGYVQP